MLSTLPPIKGMSPYTLGLIRELSNFCEIDFYGFKSIYPEFLYPDGTKTNEIEPKIKNIKIKNYLTWYNPLSWIKTGFSVRTKIFHVQWWSWFLAPEYIIVLLIAKIRKKRIIMTIHNVKPHEKSFIKNFLNNFVINIADEYIVHSKENKKQFLEVKKTKKPIHIIPHGIIEIEKSKVKEEILRKKYNFSKKDKIILFFGNIRDYKGLDILLKSLKEINDKDIKLIIAGKPWGDFIEYTFLINKLGLNKRIKLFLKFNSNEKVAELFKISDLVVFPYKEFEASSGAGSIALNFEKAIVVTDSGGLPEIVKDKEVIARPNDINDLKEKIIYGLKNKKKLEKDSKEKSFDFSWIKIAKMTGEVYKV